MNQPRNKKAEIASIRRDLMGERTVALSRIGGDTGTDEGERRTQLIWQNFRVKNCTSAHAVVLGTDHPEFAEGKDAAAQNSQELFENELYQAGIAGVALDRLCTVHSHYFGGGFEKIVGKKLRQFVKEKFDFDDKAGRAKAPTKMLNVLRRQEARSLVAEEEDFLAESKEKMLSNRGKNYAPPNPVGLAPTEMGFDPDKRPRYASTKMTPDECEERGPPGGMVGLLPGKGGGKGGPVFGF